MRITKLLVSAVKRNDMKEVMAQILDENGLTEEAKNVRDAGRKTVKLVDENFIAVDGDAPEQDEPTEEATEEAPKKSKKAKKDEKVAEAVEEAVTTEEPTPAREIELLIEGEEFKKAKKLLKKLDPEHPNHKEFKKAIKKGLK